jgi:hypothetical protein
MTTKIRKRSRSTKHARLRRNDAVLRKISTLIRAWDVVDPATRAERLKELIGLGCSRRGLAADIGVSATSIRFHLDLTNLSPAQTELVRNGGSAKEAFLAVQDQRAACARIERMRQERKTAVVSDQLANDIARFCLGPHMWRPTEEPVGICETDIEMFWLDLSGWMRMYRHDQPLTPSPASVRLKFDAISQACRPKPEKFEFWFGWLTEWLALTLLSAAPDALIREAALRKAPGILIGLLRKRATNG